MSQLTGKCSAREDVGLPQAGAGGTDAQDWAEMLERMYLRWAAAQGFSAQATERSPGAPSLGQPFGERPAAAREGCAMMLSSTSFGCVCD